MYWPGERSMGEKDTESESNVENVKREGHALSLSGFQSRERPFLVVSGQKDFFQEKTFISGDGGHHTSFMSLCPLCPPIITLVTGGCPLFVSASPPRL